MAARKQPQGDSSPPPDLTGISFLAELPEKRRRFLAGRFRLQRYPAGSQIIRRGRRGAFFGLLESGAVVLENPDSKPRVLQAGDHFGSAMLLYGKPSGFTATAREDTSLWVLRRADWLAPTPQPAPPRKRILQPGLARALAVTALVLAALAMFIIVLGPSILDRTTTTLPARLAERGRPDLAERYLREVIRLQPGSARNYGYLGDILVLEGRDPAAIEAYQEALALDEYLPWIQNNLGVLLLEGGQAEAAAGHLERASELSPISSTIFVNLGSAYYALEEWEAAAAAYGSALELDFSLLDTKASWAGLILSESRLVEARLVWEDVLATDPRHPLALEGLGVVALLEDDPALAMMYFDAARYLNPEDPALHLYIGMALEELNNPSEAARAYRFAAEHGSNAELISLARAMLEVVLEGKNVETGGH